MIIEIHKLTNIYIALLCITYLVDIAIVIINTKNIGVDNYYFNASINFGVVASSCVKLLVLLFAIYLLHEPSPGIRAWPIVIAVYMITVLKMLISLKRSNNRGQPRT